ncbi:MAG TPA: magnesium-translocating P-type ATPase [Burkholderiales bacterium]|nr:magnesium-translocating P-type ATPase [Burkholderiales bacterium]
MKSELTKDNWLRRLFLPRREKARLAISKTIESKYAKPDVTAASHSRNWLIEAAHNDILNVLGSVHSSPSGLGQDEAQSRLKEHGLNEVAHEQPATWYRQLWHAYNNPFNLLLTGLAVVSFITEDIKATTILSVMVVLSSLLRFVQEYRSSKAAEKLKAMVSTTATVRRTKETYTNAHNSSQPILVAAYPRGFETQEIPLKYLVPGDVVHLSAGDMIPADVRLLLAKDLFISQAALTGESFPVEKNADTVVGDTRNPLDLPNICFMGSNVVSGTAIAVVVATGGQTYFGGLSQRIVGHRVPTEFDKGIHRVSWLLIRFMAVMAALVFLINGITKGNWTEASLFAIAVAVGLTPEMLPMIITATLAKGAVMMSRRKVIVKRLNSIQSFGAMDILCADKTGTLTQDRIILVKYVDVNGDESEEVLRHAFLNSHYQTGLKNLLDKEVLRHAEIADVLKIATNYSLVDEIPFDFVRRRMSVVVNEREDHNELICKGAVEEVLKVSSQAKVNGHVVPLNGDLETNVMKLVKEFNEDGLRVIAVAYKETPPHQKSYGIKDESDLTLLGFIAFLDPPKETAGPAITALKQNGVQIKILTGDNEVVTCKICRDVGIDAGRVVLGSEIEDLSDAELAELAERAAVFAKLSPAQKERIVRVLQLKGHVVGFLGDGFNDSAALRTADIGISVDTAVDIAKESADIILLEKHLMVLEEGVLEGRKTFGNIVKYIKMAASSNFGNMFSVLGASTFLPFLPMLPIQLLIQNLLYDISQIAIPFDSVDKEYSERPRKWEIGALGRFMVFIGPISSVFDYATFAVMWFAFSANTIEVQSLFQSGWFIEGLLSQTLIVHIIRTGKIPFIQSRATLPLLLMTASVMAIGIYIPFSPIAHVVGLRPLPGFYFAWLAGILFGYTVLTQFVKVWFIRKYGFN